MKITPPFPYFGGKRHVADIVWQRFGNPQNYVEPFAGGLGVLLGRPHTPKRETINDKDCFVANFWRATKHASQEVAMWADNPVNHADLTARHKWLIERDAFRARMKSDPDFYDAKIAGWWAWGISCEIGGGWCVNHYNKIPFIAHNRGLNSKLVIGDSIFDYFDALKTRLKNTFVVCGDWHQITGNSVFLHSSNAIFLDPPYDVECKMKYLENAPVSTEVREWAIEMGKSHKNRVALCGYEGEHEMPEDWEVYLVKKNPAYGNLGDGRGKQNAKLERIWFSPHCIREYDLFTQR